MALGASVTIAGNLTADPELRYTKQNKAVAAFTVAHTPSKYNQTTKKFEDGETVFLRCSVWDDMAEHMAHSLHKGDRVVVSGQMKANTFTDRGGNEKTSLELTVDEVGASLKFANMDVQRHGRGGGGRPSQNSGSPKVDSDGWATVDDDDTPF